MTSRRMVDPAIWQSEDFAGFTFRQRVLFIGLFSNADDQGRMLAHPNLVRSKVFPYDDIPIAEIETDLAAIRDVQCIELYSVSGKATLQLLNWWTYQAPQWAYPSKYDPPPDWTDRLRYRKDRAIITKNWETPGGKAVADGVAKPLPKALPKESPEPIAGPVVLELDLELEVELGAERAADAPSATADILPANPTTFPEWQEEIRAAKNRPAALKRMCESLYPGLDLPTYGRIGTVATKVGGAGRLAELLWQHCTRPPTGNLLSYIQAVAKGNGRNGESSFDTTLRVIQELEAEENAKHAGTAQ